LLVFSLENQEIFSFQFTLVKDLTNNDNQQELYYVSDSLEQDESRIEKSSTNKRFLTVSFWKEDKHVAVLSLLMKNKLLEYFRTFTGTRSCDQVESIILSVSYGPPVLSEKSTGVSDKQVGSNNATQNSVLGKRRLSKAERKRLAKQPKNNTSDNQTEEMDGELEVASNTHESDSSSKLLEKCQDENETALSVYFSCKISQNDDFDFHIELSLLSDYSVCENLFSFCV
jgi:hypothetical protein